MSSAAPYLKPMLAALSLVILSVSCNGRREFSAYRNIAPGAWKYGEVIDLRVPVDTAGVLASPTLVLTVNESFRFTDMPLELRAGHRCDTIVVPVCPDKDSWQGSGKAGRYQITRAVPYNLRGHDTVSVKVRNILRADSVIGIEQLGLFLTEVKK